MKAIALLLLSVCVADVLFKHEAAAQTPPAGDSDAPARMHPGSAVDGSLDAQFADALFELARARLQRAMHLNSAFPGVIPADDLAATKGELAALSKKGRKDGEVVDWFSMLIGMAEVQNASANADWNQLSALQQKDPKSYSELDVEVARLRAQLADLNLKRGRMAAKGTADKRQNWALLYIAMQLQELGDDMRVVENKN